MQDGQADSGPETLDSIAQFLVDNPEADAQQDDEHNPDEPQEDNSEDQPDQSAEDPAGDAESDADESEDSPEPAPGQKFKVTVKGDDGADQEVEVDQQELIQGYQRHSDYTKKTQALAEREREAYQVVTSKVQEFQQHYTQQAQNVRAVLHQIGGFRSPAEMAQLAQTDPSAWVQEDQRQRTLNSVIAQIDQSLQHEAQQAQQIERERFQASQKRMAEVLTSEGFDIPKMQGLAVGVNKAYGFNNDELRNINDPRLVRMMRDAVAFRDLQAKKSEAVKKAKNAPRLPAPKQPASRTERADKAMSQRFRSGRATTGDLAAFLYQNRK